MVLMTEEAGRDRGVYIYMDRMPVSRSRGSPVHASQTWTSGYTTALYRNIPFPALRSPRPPLDP
jgi:hypothetical protein